VNTTASASGLFSISVPLNLDQSNTLQVQAADASGNASEVVNTDTAGNPLVITNDSTPPTVDTFFPAQGAADIAIDTAITVTFSESIKGDSVNDLNFSLEGSTVPGTFTLVGDTGFTFTPDQPLEYSHAYTATVRAGGIRDLAGNGLTAQFTFTFTAEASPVPIITIAIPDSGVQSTSFQVTFNGSNLASATSVISGNPGISGTISSAVENSVIADITIDSAAAAGLTTLGLSFPGDSKTVAFTVLHRSPVITAISPASGNQGATVSAQIQGSGFTDFTGISIDGAGVIVNNPGPNSDTVLNVEFVIDAHATPGARAVTVTTPGGSAAGTFTVMEVYFPPTISAIEPGGGIPGATVTAQIKGTHLDHITDIGIDGAGVTVTDLGTGSDTSRDVEFVINPAAALGLRTVTYTTPGGSATGGFEVVAPPNPATVNPLPVLTNQSNVQVTGSADPDAIITVKGGLSDVSVTAMGDGAFSISVPLNIDAVNNLERHCIQLLWQRGSACNNRYRR